ncbi:MAG: sulfurtransferase [Bacteroidetes bacterium]|jgi:phage shock protein E|nr:sulfurtransferase [Bacteroidota bacterium]
MAGFLSNLFKLQDSVDFKVLLENGALLVDVRTREEYKSAHGKGSVNIPLDTIASSLSKFPMDKVIIVVCQSGMRSKNAASFLKSKGYKEVYNGGSWFNFQ